MIHLITGGSGSGKSAFAENCVMQSGASERFYIATMKVWAKKDGDGSRNTERCAREKDLRRLSVRPI